MRGPLVAMYRAPGVWAIADQGIVSIGTFVVTLILGRSLAPADFGVFGVLMGLLVAAMTVHTSLIGVPLMVLTGRSTSQRQLPALALALAAVSTAVFVVVLAVAVAVLGRPGVLPWVGFALAGAEAQETLRRSLMGRLQFRRAVVGDGVSYLGQALGVAVLASVNRATVEGAFAVMGISSLLAGALQLWQVRPSFEAHAFGAETIRPFWRLGRSLVVVNGIGIATFQWMVWVIAVLKGVPVVGSFQALLTVIGPTRPLMQGANSLVTARAAHVQERDPARERDLEVGVARHYGLVVGAPLVLYSAILLAVPGPMLGLFFGPGSVYRALATELRVFVFFALGQYVYFVASGVLSVRHDMSALLRAQVVGAVAVPLVVLLTALWSLQGAVVAAVVHAAARAAVSVSRCLAPPSPVQSGP